MPDNSLVPCAICKHKQADHDKNYPNCHTCGNSILELTDPSSKHRYKRLENLEYFEWCYDYNLRRKEYDRQQKNRSRKRS